jgi:hypothetical protein
MPVAITSIIFQKASLFVQRGQPHNPRMRSLKNKRRRAAISVSD